MLDEVWKACKHYEGLYDVSNYGRVRNHRTGKIMVRTLKSNGYFGIKLYKNGVGKTESIHRLVAMAFIPNPENKPTVNHLDEDKQNNYYKNLCWMTYKENNTYGNRIKKATATNKKRGHYKKTSERMKGETNPSKLNPKFGAKNSNSKKVECAGVVFGCIKECAEFFGINYSTMRYWLSNDAIPVEFERMNLSYC